MIEKNRKLTINLKQGSEFTKVLAEDRRYAMDACIVARYEEGRKFSLINN